MKPAFHPILLLKLLLATMAAAQTTAVNSPSFDFVRRVNHGTSSVFAGDSGYFSTNATGGENSAQQTWFKVKNAVSAAAAGNTINTATLVFRSGQFDSAPRTVYLTRTTLAVTAAATRDTYDGTSAWPAIAGSSDSFSGTGYLAEPVAVAIDSSGAGSVDVTDWVKNHPDDVWFLTSSPAPAGTTVTSAAGATWGSSWHWQNALTLNGGSESPIQLLLNFALPADSPPVISEPLPPRAAHYAGEPLSLSITADTGTAPLSYVWRKNGQVISGAVSNVLSFSPLAQADAGDYEVTVTNIHGSVTSAVCDLTVIAPPDLAGFTPPPGSTTRYHAQGNSVIGINQGRYFNRPLYVNNTDNFVLTGDKPMAKFASGTGNALMGKFFVGIIRGGSTKWLHDCADIRAGFQSAHTTWQVTDSAFPGLSVKLQITTLAGSTSFAARASVSGAQAGDKLVWAYGGTQDVAVSGNNLNWAYDPYTVGNTALLAESFSPGDASGNVATIHAGSLSGAFSTVPSAGSSTITFGRCSVGTYHLGNASSWTTPASLLASSASGAPLLCGEIPLDTTPAATWSFTRMSALPTALPDSSEPNAAFTRGLLRSADFASRLFLDTPEPRLDAAAAIAVAGVDGAWYGSWFAHGAMSWNSRFIGWRTTIGGTMLGWHDRVKTSADYFLPTQITSSSYTSGEARGGNFLLTQPATTSRFYGKGYISQGQDFYDMQTQYFDQILQDWRWRPTDDPAHEAKLRTALELHLERMAECFDLDNNGAYESVLNTWPTDSIWFNGGGCPDETAYAYRGHGFARDLALRAGDAASAAAHQAKMTQIRNALISELWVTSKGHLGLFREQGGHQRLVDNPWLYSLCVPIEAGMLTPEQAASNLHYTEHGLENFPMPAGGRRVITSNFTPSIWSTRELWPGDNYMLAQSYFQSGLARDGWEVLRGTIFHSGFNDIVPGDSAGFVGGTDFGDSVHPFTRTIVEALFGYQPDFPNGKVRVAPQFPADWDHASMKTPNVRLAYSRATGSTTLNVRIMRSTSLDVEIPVHAQSVTAVTIDGVATAFTTSPGFGCTIVKATTPITSGVAREIIVTTSTEVAEAVPTSVEGVTGSAVNLAVSGGSILSFTDGDGALTAASLSGGTIHATLSANLGHHRVLATTQVGSLTQARIIDLHILADPTTPATTLPAVPVGAAWETIPMNGQLAANITQIYEQQYVSPRPATNSSRIGTDGYSPWTFPWWGITRPTISINNVAGLLDPGDNTRLLTPQGVPFRWGGNSTNVAFTSLWDNWADSVTVPVNRSAEAAWFLICGSTTVIQNRISNAVIRLSYADGVEETLELIPPYNYWNLSPITGITTYLQSGATDYTEPSQAYMVPTPWPMTVQLGTNCRAMLLNRKLRPGVKLSSVTLEAMSEESVIGLMGVTLMNPVAVPQSAGLLLNDDFDSPNYGASVFNDTLSADQSGSMSPLSYTVTTAGEDWQAQHGNGAAMLLVGDTGYAATASLNLDLSTPANEANLPLSIQLDARVTDTTNAATRSSITIGSAQNIFADSPAAKFGIRPALGGAMQVWFNGAQQVLTSHAGNTFRIVLSDSTGKRSAFNGNGSKAALYDGTTLVGTYTLPQLAAGDGYLSFAAQSGVPYNHTRIDNLNIELISDYHTWATFHEITGGQNGDDDQDGLANFDEYAFGLDPKSGASVRPITILPDPATGTFTYTRRKTTLTGLSYSVWYSTDLAMWLQDAGATEGTPAINGDLESVPVQISNSLLSQPKLFVQIRTN